MVIFLQLCLQRAIITWQCVTASLVLFILLFYLSWVYLKEQYHRKKKSQGSLVCAVSDLDSVFHWNYSVLTGSQLNIKCLRENWNTGNMNSLSFRIICPKRHTYRDHLLFNVRVLWTPGGLWRYCKGRSYAICI